jgi:hypothetical protein
MSIRRQGPREQRSEQHAITGGDSTPGVSCADGSRSPDTPRERVSDSDDEAPPTPREQPKGSHAAGLAYVVVITYREPGYAQHSGTDKSYSGRFTVWAPDERSAIAQAKAEFEAVAARSGVGWVRDIEGVDCQQVNDVVNDRG